MDNIRAYAFRPQGLGEFAGEESAARRHAKLLGRLGRTFRRIYAKHRNSSVDIVFQQITVITCQFDDEAAGSKLAPRNEVEHVLARMLEQRGREGREIGIGVGEEDLRVRRLSDLHQTALVAEGNLERKRELSLAEIGLCQKAIGERCLAEIKERLQPRAAARPASHLSY